MADLKQKNLGGTKLDQGSQTIGWLGDPGSSLEAIILRSRLSSEDLDEALELLSIASSLGLSSVVRDVVWHLIGSAAVDGGVCGEIGSFRPRATVLGSGGSQMELNEPSVEGRKEGSGYALRAVKGVRSRVSGNRNGNRD